MNDSPFSFSDYRNGVPIFSVKNCRRYGIPVSLCCTAFICSDNRYSVPNFSNNDAADPSAMAKILAYAHHIKMSHFCQYALFHQNTPSFFEHIHFGLKNKTV
jgi:hypothetical protein